MPGKTVGFVAECGPDATLGGAAGLSLSQFNDPGEMAQAKRRTHATLVDHLIPPMAGAETYGDIARLEHARQHANIAALDRESYRAIRQQIWTLMHCRPRWTTIWPHERPDDHSFDDMPLHVDGWLCEIRMFRSGTVCMSLARASLASELDLVLPAILRAPAVVLAGEYPPGLRPGPRTGPRAAAATARRWTRRESPGPRRTAGPSCGHAGLGCCGGRTRSPPPIPASLRFRGSPHERGGTPSGRHRGEIDRGVLRASRRRYIPAGPSGLTPLRG